MSLATRNLSYGYADKIVGRGATLDVAPGEVVALLGPNGGGKTTLLKTMLGLLPPLGGKIMLDDEDLAAITVGARARKIGYVPQASASPFAFSVREIVLMGRTAHGGVFAAPSRGDFAVADGMLERMGIAHLAERPITMISGGERQLALVARALTQEPRYIVLDEPTASLDFGNQGRVLRIVRELAASGLGVLFTTHDPNQVTAIATRVAMIHDGRLDTTIGNPDVLNAEILSKLYGSPVRTVKGVDGARAYLPG